MTMSHQSAYDSRVFSTARQYHHILVLGEDLGRLMMSDNYFVVVTCSYYNTGNYATRSTKIEQLRINRLANCALLSMCGGWDNNSICALAGRFIGWL